MNEQILSEAGINYSEGVARFAGKEALYLKYLLRFPEDTTFSGLCGQMEQHDYTEAFRSAHTLKGIVGNLSLDAFYNLLNPFVDMLRDGANIPAAETAFPALCQSYEKTVAAIKQMQ